MCPNECTSKEHGECVDHSKDKTVASSKEEDKSCVCVMGYTGEDCSSIDLCPNNCNDNGSCVHDKLLKLKSCQCDIGWTGIVERIIIIVIIMCLILLPGYF